MLINQRKGCFETNSSSMHSVVITPNDYTLGNPINLSVEFSLREFEWEECSVYTEPNIKASFLYTYYLTNDDIYTFNERVISVLDKYGIKHTINETDEDNACCLYNNCMSDALDIVDNVTATDEVLLNFLFNPNFQLISTNDNEGYDILKDLFSTDTMLKSEVWGSSLHRSYLFELKTKFKDTQHTKHNVKGDIKIGDSIVVINLENTSIREEATVIKVLNPDSSLKFLLEQDIKDCIYTVYRIINKYNEGTLDFPIPPIVQIKYKDSKETDYIIMSYRPYLFDFLTLSKSKHKSVYTKAYYDELLDYAEFLCNEFPHLKEDIMDIFY